MIRILYITLITCTLYATNACNDKHIHNVKVKLHNLHTGKIFAVLEAQDHHAVDTLYYDSDYNDEFNVTSDDDDFKTLTLYFENHTQVIHIYLEPFEKINVTGDVNYTQLVRIKGGDINNTLNDFQTLVYALRKEQADIQDDTYNIDDENKARLDNIQQELKQHAVNFVKEHNDKQAATILINDYIFDPNNPTQAEELLNSLQPDAKKYYLADALLKDIEKAKLTMIGTQAPDFIAKTNKGVNISKTSMQGKAYLLAFVTNHNDEKQIDITQLDKIADNYNNKQLNIIVVCLDHLTQNIQNNNTHFHVVTDSDAQAVQLVDKYNITALPTCILINQQGIIVGKTNNADELTQLINITL